MAKNVMKPAGMIHVVGSLTSDGLQTCVRCGARLPTRDPPFEPQALLELPDGSWRIYTGESDAVPCAVPTHA